MSFLSDNKVGPIIGLIIWDADFHQPTLQRASKHEPVDEERVTQAHEKAYNQGSAGDLSAHDLGGAAALQVHSLVSKITQIH